jgi:hypothetical protein
VFTFVKENATDDEVAALDKTQKAVPAAIPKLYPKAKAYLAGLGKSPEQIEAMPPEQVVLIYSFDRFRHWQNHLFKWYGLAYWQAREGIERAETEFGRIRKEGDYGEGVPFTEIVPSFARACFILARADREIAALRCIEAIRMHAAASDGKLPRRLEDITEVPIPIDPVTGKGFDYKVTGDTAVLEALAPKGALPGDGVRYKLTIAK